MQEQTQISLNSFKNSGGFIRRCQMLVKDVVIPYQYAVLNDEIEGAEPSHVIANFVNAAKALNGGTAADGFYGMVFQDSDAAKWLEAAACSLSMFPDVQLERLADGLIDIIAAAQDEDGYLNTYYTISNREKRWTNLQEGHELYCAGHMMEAASSYYEATGKDKLLKIMLKNAEHIHSHFVAEGRAGYPGHPEVELALIRLYEASGDVKCLELAKHFIDVRGVDSAFYEKESAERGWSVWGSNPRNVDYMQAGKPVRMQSEATGHSVRAMYLYTGMARLAALTDDAELAAACRRLWDSVIDRRMYVTGGIGSTVIGEAFTVDYDLPNDTAYSETCASVGLVFFASGMLGLEADAGYADVMERAFYNTVLAGMQLDGKRFFYVNPLEVVPGISGKAPTHRHVLPERPGWYACACCPPNAARLIASIGKYAYGETPSGSSEPHACYCHLFVEGVVTFSNGMMLECKTDYPYGFTVTYTVTSGYGALAIRRPGYCSRFLICINGREADAVAKKGYYFIKASQGDVIEVTLDDEVKRVYGSPRVPRTSGCAALQRGPLVYCAEGADNGGDVLSLRLKENGQAAAGGFEPETLGGIVRIRAEGWRISGGRELYSYERPAREECNITLIPYYAWGNRGLNQMRVWIPE